MIKPHYDYIVLGSGPAGYVSAIRASQLGKKVLVIEKDRNMLGGVCLNEGCIPAKSIFNSAKIFDLARKNKDLFSGPFEGSFNIAGFIARSQRSREILSKGLEFLFRKNGIDTVYGSGQLKNRDTVMVTGERGETSEVHAESILVATGSRPCEIAGVNVDGKNILTSRHALDLKEIPADILIIGAGAIGIEFASFYSILGAEVTVMEVEDRILPKEDKEVSSQVASLYKKRGITFLTGCRIKEVFREGDSLKVLFLTAGGQEERRFKKVLMAAGRVPSSAGIGLGEIGVDIDNKGFINTGKDLRTNIKNIFAAGDVINTPMLAHVAYIEGEKAAEAAAGLKTEPVDYENIPSAVYSDIKIASVGFTEEELKEKGINCKTGKHFFRSIGRAVTEGETEGFVKVLADAASCRILGVHIVGHTADELINEFALAKRSGLTVDQIAGTTHAHPTFSEIAQEACRAVSGKAIHA